MRLSPALSERTITTRQLITDTQGVIGKRGMGKTSYAVVCVEEMLKDGAQVVIIDPTGGWWGLRADINGDPAKGHPIPIFGGQHGDLPIEDTGGKVLAEYVVENRLSCVLDFGSFTKSGMRRFAADFFERFYQLKDKHRDPVHVVIDECDLFCPQRADEPTVMRSMGAVNDLVLRGRIRGIGVSLISQRPARINKDVLTQIEMLVSFRLTGPQDIKAFSEWIEYNGTKEDQKRVLASLSSLERGQGWLWAPGLKTGGILECLQFRPRETYDSSATPDGKTRRKPPKTLRDVDLGQLSSALSQAVKQAESNDPKKLQATVIKLTKQLDEAIALGQNARAGQLQAEAEKPRAIKEVQAVSPKTVAQLEAALKRAEKHIEQLTVQIETLATNDAIYTQKRREIVDTWSQRAQVLTTALGNLQHEVYKMTRAKETGPARPTTNGVPQRLPIIVQTPTVLQQIEPQLRAATFASWLKKEILVDIPGGPIDGNENAGALKLSKLQKTVIASLRLHGPQTKKALGVLVGRSHKSGHFNNELGALRTYAVINEGEPISLAAIGTFITQDVPPLPSGRALFEDWKANKVGKCGAEIMDVVAGDDGGGMIAMTKEEIAACTASKYDAGGGHFNNEIGRLKTLGIIEEVARGKYQLAVQLQA